MKEYTITILIDADNFDEAEQYARGIVLPYQPIDFVVTEMI